MDKVSAKGAHRRFARLSTLYECDINSLILFLLVPMSKIYYKTLVRWRALRSKPGGSKVRFVRS